MLCEHAALQQINNNADEQFYQHGTRRKRSAIILLGAEGNHKIKRLAGLRAFHGARPHATLKHLRLILAVHQIPDAEPPNRIESNRIQSNRTESNQIESNSSAQKSGWFAKGSAEHVGSGLGLKVGEECGSRSTEEWPQGQQELQERTQ